MGMLHKTALRLHLRRGDRRLVLWLMLVCCLLPLPAARSQASDGDVDFLMVKYGDESAQQEIAAEFLQKLATYLQNNIELFHGKKVRGRITNTPQQAEALLTKHQPALAFVPPAFYLAHLQSDSRHAVPVLQIPRFGKQTETYYLVTHQTGPESLHALQGHTVRTTFALDLEYLRTVVFPDDHAPGDFFELEGADNLADEVFLLIENATGGPGAIAAASALLFDEELKQFFEDDEMVWPELKIIWQSNPLPRDLVVTIGPDWSEASRQQLRQALLNMPADESGAEILALMQSSGFAPVDKKTLEYVRDEYGGQP